MARIRVSTATAQPTGGAAGTSVIWGLTLALAILFALFPVMSEDIWWHLKLGELIVQTRHFPSGETLVHTVPAGTRFSDTQWLFQVVVYAIHQVGGWNGIVAFRIAQTVALAALVLAWLRERKTPLLATFATAMLVLNLVCPRINDRPELLSFVCIAAQLWILDRNRRGYALQWKAFLLVQIVWANFHTSVLLGVVLPVVFGITLWAHNFLRAKEAVDANRDSRRLLLLGAAAAVVSLCNPSGWVMLTYGLTESAKGVIQEFGAPWKSALFAEGVVAMAQAAIGAWRFTPARQRWPWLVWGIICAAEYLSMVRFLPYAALSWVPLLSSGIASAESAVRRKGVAVGLRALVVVLLMLITAHTLYALSLNRRYGRGGVDFSPWPVAAADYVIQNHVSGRIFNGFNEGGYLLWRLAPARQVFMFNETRLNAHTLQQGQRIHTADAFRSWLDGYGVTYSILPYNTGSKAGRPLVSWAEVFWKSPEWVPVFWDDTAMVWLKNVPENRELIARDRCVVNPETNSEPG